MKYLTAGSRTIIIARLMALIALVQEFGTQIIPDGYTAYVLFGAAVLMEMMRWVTVKPIGAKSTGNGFDDGGGAV